MGTKDGGAQAARTNKEKYGKDYYREIGKIGGKLGKTGGFAAGEEGRERARICGAIGGRKSRRVYTDAEKKASGERLLAGRMAKRV